MAVGNRPDSSILNTAWPNYAAIADVINFTDGSGSVITAMAGDNYSVVGIEDTDFEWLTSQLNGGAIRLMTDDESGGGILGPVASGDQLRTEGTIAFAIQFPSGGGGYVYTTGDVGPVDGQLHVWIDASDFGFEHNPIGAGTNHSEYSSQGFPVDTWIPVVLRWTGSAIYLDAIHPTEGKISLTYIADGASVVISDTNRERFGGHAKSGYVSRLCTIGQILRLTAAIDDDDADILLGDIFSHLREDYGHDFLTPFAHCTDQTTTSVKIGHTAAAGASVTVAIKYWVDGDNEETESTTTDPVASTGGVDEELVEVEITGLTAHTRYRFKVIENLNGGGASELAREGQFCTLSVSNDDDVVTAAIGDDHCENNAPGDDANLDQDIDSVADVISSHGVQFMVHVGDRAGVDQSYIVGRQSLVTQFINWSKMFERVLSLVATKFTDGNHDSSGAAYYGNYFGYWQQWGTELFLRFLCAETTDCGIETTDWALAADIAGDKRWVQSPNRPPFPGVGFVRHGPILHVWLDSERCADQSSANVGNAENSTFGPMIAWAISVAASSPALYKILDFHRPPGGKADDNATQEAYRRGNVAGVSLESAYQWYIDYPLLRNKFNVIRGWHDHIAAAVRVVGDSCICLSGGSPSYPFSNAQGYNRGYNSNGNDPVLGPFDDGTPNANLECLFSESVRGMWIHKANATRMLSQYVRTVNDARDGTLNEVIFTHETLPTGSSGGRTFSLGIGV